MCKELHAGLIEVFEARQAMRVRADGLFHNELKIPADLRTRGAGGENDKPPDIWMYMTVTITNERWRITRFLVVGGNVSTDAGM